MTKWQEVKLGDVCDLIAGFAFKSKDFGNYPDKVIKITNIEPPFVNMANLIGVDISKYNRDKLKKFLATKGDYVLAMTGATIGKLGRIYQDEAYINQRVLMFKAKKDTNQYFLYYVLSSYNFSQYILKHIDSESAQANISANTVGKYIFSLPPLEEQKKIAGVLGALDDKIELNNKINQNLESQAQVLFKSWFVDFEPFGGKMPDDWKIKTIGDVCASISETYNRKDENVVLINTSDVLNGEILTHTLVKNENLKGQFKKTFQKNDILYSEIRPINKRFAFVDIENTYNYIASTKLMVIRPDTSKISPLILYRILKSQDLIDELQHLAETRSGTFPQITFASELAIQKIVLAPLNEQKRISNVLEVLENKIRKNIQENLRLAELRDALLPKLMSGEINVDDVKID